MGNGMHRDIKDGHEGDGDQRGGKHAAEHDRADRLLARSTGAVH